MAVRRLVKMGGAKPPVKPLTKPAPKAAPGKPPLRGRPGAGQTSRSTGEAPSHGRSTGGFARAREENEAAKLRREQGLLPFRLRLKPGEETTVIILDAGEPFFMYEHNWEGADGHFDNFSQCTKDAGPCPECRRLGKEGYYVMMLTCLDRRPYTDKNGKVIKVSKKLLPVKASMIPKFERLYKKKNTFRGMEVTLIRDTKQDPQIGSSVEFVKFHDEKFLAGLKTTNKDGKQVPLAVPVDYDKAFPYPDPATQRAGGRGPAGSEDFSEGDNDLGSVDWST